MVQHRGVCSMFSLCLLPVTSWSTGPGSLGVDRSSLPTSLKWDFSASTLRKRGMVTAINSTRKEILHLNQGLFDILNDFQVSCQVAFRSIPFFQVSCQVFFRFPARSCSVFSALCLVCSAFSVRSFGRLSVCHTAEGDFAMSSSQTCITIFICLVIP